MKHTPLKKFLCAALATVMVLLMLPVTTRAAENTYVLDATTDLTAFAQDDKADGATETVKDFFTVIYSAKNKVDGSNKTFSDGYTASQRLNFGGKTDPEKGMINSVKFTVDAAATVKIWWVSGGDGRNFAIYNDAGTVLTETTDASVKNSLYISTLSIAEAGTYHLGVPQGSNYLFKVEVTVSDAGELTPPESSEPQETQSQESEPQETQSEESKPEEEQLPANTYVLDATKDLTAFAQGAKSDGDTESFKDYFTVMYSGKNKVDGSNKTFSDGYTASQRLNFGGKTDPEKGMINSVQFTANHPATVKIWWVSGGDGRNFAIYNNAGTVLAETTDASVKNTLYISELEVDAAGTYYLGVPQGSNYLFRMQVTEYPPKEYVLDATKDLTAFAQGAKADGDTETVKDFFTVMYSGKNKVDGSNKTFSDGYTASQRLNFGGKTDPDKGMINSVKFTVDKGATVKIWWVSGGDGRNFAIYSSSGTVLTETTDASVKNSLYISTLSIAEGGTYYLGVPQGSNYLFKIQVTVDGGAPALPPRADWETVAAPVIGTAADDGAGKITVSVTADVSRNGADEVVVTMYDAEGNALATQRSTKETTGHALTFQPTASGTYTFKASLNRKDEESKLSEADGSCSFTLPLAEPILSSATSTGNGKVEIVWGEVAEADSYIVYCDGTAAGTTAELKYEVSGLTIGQEYSFTVCAVRGEEISDPSDPLTAVVTGEAQRAWGFTRYGSSTNDASNGYEGNLNTDGKVTVYSEGGKGKIVPNSTDGLAFYYTAIPANYNFTLRATVTVDSWTLSNGQEGFGIMAADRLGPNGSSTAFWNNQYMAIASKVEYNNGGKYSMKLGLGAMEKIGVTPENLDKLNANDSATVTNDFQSSTVTLDHTPEDLGKGAGTYNIVGNCTNAAPGTIAEQTSFVLEIQKNNTGYFVSYYDADGKLITRQKYYEPDALNMVDKDNVYVGFFAARNARATFSNVELDVILAANDKPAEERPVTKITPTVAITSASTANAVEYTAYLSANVAGTATVSLEGNVVAENVALVAGERKDVPVTLTKIGDNHLSVVFTPDPDQDLGEFTELASTDPVKAELTVNYQTTWQYQNNLYVSPNGTPEGKGTKDSPLDIYTAVKYVKAGQTIILMEGTYALDTPVKIEHGIDGTKDSPIRMIADPEAASRPVLDFQKKVTGITHGGDYWYFQGFDVTNSANGQKGFQVSGHYNTLDQVNAYNNGNTGIQLSRYAGSDPRSEWPSHNLILNCTSYNNADAGYEDADGFAAKLTCGEGNVFDGCVAYNNADDGWDLYAKVETGSIGAVTIQNCVAYQNGYVMEDGKLVKAGNGNGFKMGGESLSGKHQLINSYAFFNKAKGFDSNSCPDIVVKNSTSYNNESYNVAFYTNNAANTDFAAEGIISFKDDTIKSGLSTGENLKPKGTQDTAKYLGDSNYYWDGTASKNASGKEVTADMFVSLTFQGVKRNADGTIDLQGFLELKESLGSGAGTDGTGSDKPVVTPDKEPDTPDVDPDETTTAATTETTTEVTTEAATETTTEAPAETTKPAGDDDSSDTGDTALILPALLLMAVSAFAMAGLSQRKKQF